MTAPDAPPPLAGYDAMTAHVRFAPFQRRFAYKLAQILIDVDQPREAARGLSLLGVERFSLFSFYNKDHGDRSGATLRPWVEAALAKAGVQLDGGPIRLLCFPRVLGYVFNPLSIFFGYGPDGRLRGVIYEVNNTFGETHSYVAVANGDELHAHNSPKRFHVSPFMDVKGEYRFRLSPPGEAFYLFVENHIDGARAHVATLIGRKHAVTDRWLLGVFARLPMMTLQVIAGIHWEALWIWRRGAGYRDKPTPPQSPHSIATPATPAPKPTKEYLLG